MQVYAECIKRKAAELKYEYAYKHKMLVRTWREFARTGVCSGIRCSDCPLSPNGRACDLSAEERRDKLHERS